MAYYLTLFAYTPETWAALASKPEDRREPVRKMVEGLGGKVHANYLAFGEYDGIVLFEAPDNVAAAAGAIAAAGTGTLKAMRTIPLITWEEGLESMRKAGSISFRGAGQS